MLDLALFDQVEAPPAYHLFVPAKHNSHLLALIKIPPKEPQLPYKQLPGSNPADRSKVIELFTAFGSHNKAVLLLQYYSKLDKLGDEIEHVHPLKLLGCIFSATDPSQKLKMKGYMDNIYNDYFKWKNFFEGRPPHSGFGPNMNHEMKKNNLIRHLKAFSKEINMPEEKLLPFFNARDWRGLIKFLIYDS